MSSLSRRQVLAGGLAAGALTALPSAAAPSAPEAKFKLGLVTYNIAAAWNLPTILKVCKDVGLAAVEFRTTHKHGVEPSLTKQQRGDVRKRCEDAGVRVWGCGTTCEFQSPKPGTVRDNIETCKRFVELSADIGGKGVKVRPNGLPRGIEEGKTLEQIGKALTECGKAAESAGVEIHLEVHGRGTADPRHAKTIMDHCGHKSVGLTWNSNPEDVKDRSVAGAFKLLGPWVRSCHINRLHLADYPYRELFRLFRQSGYDRVTLIEINPSVADPAVGTEFLRYYKALWTELCQG